MPRPGRSRFPPRVTPCMVSKTLPAKSSWSWILMPAQPGRAAGTPPLRPGCTRTIPAGREDARAVLCLAAFLHGLNCLGILEKPRQKLTWLAKKCPMILTMTSSFSSGVWSRGTMTSALVKFCSSFTWSKRQSPAWALLGKSQNPPPPVSPRLRASTRPQSAEGRTPSPPWDGHHPMRATTRTRGWGRDTAATTEHPGFASRGGQGWRAMPSSAAPGQGEHPCNPHLPSCRLCLSRGRRRRKAPWCGLQASLLLSG